MASPASTRSRSGLHARDALVLEHLTLADSIATAAARHLFPLQGNRSTHRDGFSITR